MHLNARRWLRDLPLNARILLLVGLLVVVTVAITTFVVRWTTRHLVEEAIGDQMMLQARIAAHLVAIAEQKRERGMLPTEINRYLQDIVRFAREQRNFEYEFWITDGAGNAYLRTEPQEFTFKSDQPQAGVFLDLLNGESGHRDVIIQESQKREIDPSVYKYVGVSGVDQPRIVQVGYKADSLLEELAVKSSLQAAAIAGLELLAGLVAYYILRRLLTTPLNRLIRAGRAVEADEYKAGSLAEVCARGDELGRLARVFEDMVRKLAGRYESLVNLMRSVVLKIRGDRVITFANAYASELLGFANAELVGQHMNLIIPPDWQESVRQRLNALKPHEVQFNELNENVSKTGERFWIAWSNRMIESGEEQQKELLCVGHNVTDEKKHEKELENMVAQLQVARAQALDASRAKSDFLANMSHEIRTPMNAVINLTALALETDVTPRQRQYLTTVHSSARGLLALINDILDLSKVEAEKLELEAAPFRLRSALEEVTETFRAKVAEKHVELVVYVLADVPDGLIGDCLRIRQVLTNLIGNAFKFTEKGEVVLKVSVSKAAAPHPGPPPQEGREEEREDGELKSPTVWLSFEVRDTGVGIPKEKQSQLFQPFTQADSSTSRKYGGTGLGLAISRRLAKLMEGGITFESAPGRGTTFIFTARLGVQTKQEAPAPTVPPGLRDKKALVVEDTDSSRELLEIFFGSFAIPCVSVETAEKGLELLEHHNKPGGNDPFGLVLLDWRLPRMDGIDAAVHIRNREATRDVPIIIMSAYAGKEEEARSTEVGANVFLPKPITPSSLYNAIVEAKGLRPSPLREPAASDTEAEFAGARVLLAEDNETNQFVALELLGRLGIELEIATNGREAVEMVRAKKYTAVLMDIQMPEMDGLEATRRIRQEPAFFGLPIIAMTANAMKADVEACRSAGMNDFLSKPIERAALLRTLRCWLPVTRPGDKETGRQGETGPVSLSPDLPVSLSPSLLGIDVAGTVRRLALPFDRLKALLLRFADGQRETVERLRAAVAAGNAADARHHAHALAGAAGNLGADALREAARTLELAARDGNTMLEPFHRVGECAGVVFRSIELLRAQTSEPEFPGVRDGDPKDARVDLSPLVDSQSTQSLLTRLRSSLADGDLSSSTDILKELFAVSLPDDWRGQIARLAPLIDGYDYDLAAEVVDRLLASVQTKNSS
jgi:two-component system, sensor histidine kinase and response regulator